MSRVVTTPPAAARGARVPLSAGRKRMRWRRCQQRAGGRSSPAPQQRVCPLPACYEAPAETAAGMSPCRETRDSPGQSETRSAAVPLPRQHRAPSPKSATAMSRRIEAFELDVSQMVEEGRFRASRNPLAQQRSPAPFEKRGSESRRCREIRMCYAPVRSAHLETETRRAQVLLAIFLGFRRVTAGNGVVFSRCRRCRGPA